VCGAAPQVFVITNAISRLRAKVGGHKDQGLQSPRDGGANITPADGALPLQQVALLKPVHMSLPAPMHGHTQPVTIRVEQPRQRELLVCSTVQRLQCFTSYLVR
jgi:hypothetical protein